MPKKVLHPKNFNTKKVSGKPSLYLISWIDAFSDQEEWVTHQPYELQDYTVHTVGYLIPNNNPNYYTIASTYTDDSNYCCIMNIPAAMVTSKLELSPMKDSLSKQS
jgi:hypothetical protein